MGVREKDIRDYPEEATRLIKATVLAALILMVAIGNGGLSDGLATGVGDMGNGLDSHNRLVRGQEGAQVDAARTWASYPMRPGRVAIPALAPALGSGTSVQWTSPAAWDDRESVEAIICAEGTPWPCDWALAVVECEASGRMDAWATEVVRGVRYYFHGWFQIVSTSPEPGPLADPVYNTERAVWKYINEGSVHAWPGCP